MVIDVRNLRFYVLKSEDLKGDATTEAVGCSFTPIPHEDLDTYSESDRITQATCDFPTNGTLPPSQDKFRVVKQGASIRLEDEDGSQLGPHIDPTAEPLVLIRKSPTATGTPYSFMTFADKAHLTEYLRLSKLAPRTTLKNVDHPLGPAFHVSVGTYMLSAREIAIPPVVDLLTNTTLPRTAADAYQRWGLAADLALTYPFISGWWGALLETGATVGLSYRQATLEAPDTVSGIPGQAAELEYRRVGLQWRPGISTQRWARLFLAPDGNENAFRHSHWARWNFEVRFLASLIERESLRGEVPYDGDSLSAPLELGHRLDPLADRGFIVAGSYCFAAAARPQNAAFWIPCLGVGYAYHGDRPVHDSSGFDAEFTRQHDLQLLVSFGNAVDTQLVPVTEPYTIQVADVSAPTIALSAAPVPPPAMVAVDLPRRMHLKIPEIEGMFDQGDSRIFYTKRRDRASKAQVDNAQQRFEQQIIVKTGQFFTAMRKHDFTEAQVWANLGGFTNSDGSDEASFRLSLRRVGSVKDYMLQRFREENDAAWKLARSAQPSLKRQNWLAPFPTPQEIVFRTRGYGETELVCPAAVPACQAGAEDKDASRRFVIEVSSDPTTASEAMQLETVPSNVSATDDRVAGELANMLNAANAAATTYDASLKTLFVVLKTPLTWNQAALDAGSTNEAQAFQKAMVRMQPAFARLSRQVAVQIGFLSTTPPADADSDSERINAIKGLIMGKSQFATWPVPGLTGVIAIPDSQPDGITYMKGFLAGQRPVEVTDAVRARLKTLRKSVTIGETSATLYSIPVELADGTPSAPMRALATALGESLTPTDRVQVYLYINTADHAQIRPTALLRQLAAHFIQAYERTNKVSSAEDAEQFVVERVKDPLSDKATRIYVVVSATPLPPAAVQERVFHLALDTSK